MNIINNQFIDNIIYCHLHKLYLNDIRLELVLYKLNLKMKKNNDYCIEFLKENYRTIMLEDYSIQLSYDYVFTNENLITSYIDYIQ